MHKRIIDGLRASRSGAARRSIPAQHLRCSRQCRGRLVPACLTLLFLLPSIIVLPSPSQAVGILYAGVGGSGDLFQPLRVASLKADVRIVDQVAITKVDQVFANDGDRILEGIYIFPLPERATATEFALWIDGKRVVADVKEREQARQQYDAIVRRQIDPALLEYLGGNVFKASVFPIPARGSRRIEIEYAELLNYDRGEIGYTFPLRAEGLTAKPLESVVISISILSQSPITDVVSFSYPDLTKIERKSSEEATVLFGDERILPDADLRLAIRVAKESLGLSLLTYNPADSLKEDSYYIFWVTPPEELAAAEIIAKDMIFTVDVSSSMEGEKMLQTKAALRRSVELLLPADRFNIIPFSTDARRFKDDLVPATAENKAQAGAFIDGLRASGLTNIGKGMRLALAQQFSPTSAKMVVFLTDGEPTYGQTDPDSILKVVKRENHGVARIFSFGIGRQIDRGLVVRIARENGGYPVFIERDTDIEPVVNDFFDRVSRPVLTNLALDFGGLKTYDSNPAQLPDLFAGSRLFQVGRYSESRSVDIVLTGQIGGRSVGYRYPAEFQGSEGGYPFISRIWASEKIADLLEQIGLLGQQAELVDAVKALGLKYQIVTPYTSMLVLEPNPPILPPVVWRTDDGSGGDPAVFTDASTSGGSDSKAEGATEVTETTGTTWSAGGKTFTLREGIWIDASYRPGMAVTDVKLDGPAASEVLRSRPELARYVAFAAGRSLLVVLSDGAAYRVYGSSTHARAFIGRNAPNPFNPETTLSYYVIPGSRASRVRVTIEVHDILGRKVRTLVDSDHAAGAYAKTWDGRNESGSLAPSGIYFALLAAGGETSTLRMTLMK